MPDKDVQMLGQYIHVPGASIAAGAGNATMPAVVDAERNTRPRRDSGGRARHWGSDQQPESMRPSACRACREVFETKAFRMCTGGERERSRWVHPQCIVEPG
eukprot:12400907-Karenia_brevis.AAC.1